MDDEARQRTFTYTVYIVSQDDGDPLPFEDYVKAREFHDFLVAKGQHRRGVRRRGRARSPAEPEAFA